MESSKVVLESWDVIVDQILEKKWEQMYKSEGDLRLVQ